MITHQYEKDTEAETIGYFTDDIGRRICTWYWKGEFIEVVAANKMRRRVLSESEVAQYSDEDLRERLIDVAKSIAEELRGEPFE